MRLIDADALERDGWQMSRTVRVDKDTMEIQTRKPTDFPTIEPQRMRGRWVGTEFDGYADGNPVYYEWKCSACGCVVEDEEPTWNYCPNCGAEMGEQNET